MMEIKLNDEAYSATFSLSDEMSCQEVITFSINRKLTSSKDMAGYDNFIYYSDDYDLRSILLDLKFIDKQ